ncbi:MAG: DUF3391 domain-containing protein [Nitrospinae bacterium]|nr:DUF3391 domain-containing protein [Nitrospinota bacterium]
MLFEKRRTETPIKRIRAQDLRVGMFIEKLDSSWLSSPLVMSNFKVSSERDIRTLREYDIEHVFIDISKGIDVGDENQALIMPAGPGLLSMFEANLSDFWVDRPVPVDIFRAMGDAPDLLLKSGQVYSKEVETSFVSTGVSSVYIQNSQRPDFSRYVEELNKIKEQKRGEGYSGDFLNPAAVENQLRFMLNYHPINPRAFLPGSAAPCDILAKAEVDVKHLLSRGKVVEPEFISQWVSLDEKVIIRRDDLGAFQLYLGEAGKSADGKVKAAIIRENSKIIVESLAADPKSEKLVGQTKEAVQDLIGMVMENPTTFYAVMKINNFDYYTFTHSVNVSTLSIALGMAAGITSKHDLADLALGAILHDVGKSQVCPNLINKPGALTSEEFTAVASHVTKGYEMVRWNKAISAKALLPLIQHHEKLSGGGYPYGLAGDQIHIFGRIVALIDIYDALTTERSYRKAMKPFDALNIISKALNDYDAALFRLLVSIIHRQAS